jgi:hypothetical protein
LLHQILVRVDALHGEVELLREDLRLQVVVVQDVLDDVWGARLSSSLRSADVSSFRAMASPSRIFQLTSWSDVSTPAELSMKSVLIRPPPSAVPILPSCVHPSCHPRRRPERGMSLR